ncbi:MAG: AP2 domain-containing protein [Dehalococcoidia bacterium]|jgi:hypothetical protein|nr:AP2 domain-containing protein [Dehalococcoidia bacterium]
MNGSRENQSSTYVQSAIAHIGIENVKRISLTRGLSVIIDSEDFDELSKYKWYACKKRNLFYAYRDKMINKQKIHIPMHRQIMQLHSGDKAICDHINRNTLDNRKANLRIVTHSLNQYNCVMIRKNNTTGYRGITFHRKLGKWIAQIRVNNKHIYIGVFTSKEEAAKAYDKEAIKYYGKNAMLNFGEEGQ